ncbi:ndufa12-domain-containing protein [Phaffia rhodozyma]|uniref:NADH dehydrogenase [ubiquinone] 1 alpha subcomplex subunit n=1 Tax=Phaffia rhodozyma TaxID=264483 RepID=A0A0F7SNE8_PHARH|nr:ndufa12-domain-containing protein [Phaffia rhodozyma]
MVSLARTIRNIRRTGVKYWFRQMLYLCDAKSGDFVGKDRFGNKYFQNYNPEEEIPGRHRWVDYAQHNYHVSQIPPEWHSWINHIRKDPPTIDPIMKESTPTWLLPHRENMTGTRGAYKPYSTTGAKLNAWEPKVAQRG